MTEREACGLIPVFKPEGWTSFDVIAKLRGILHMKRLGHGGTLDPMATGVLPVFVGKAAKACDILPDSDKTYEAGFKLGITTDTQDITGKVLSENSRAVSSEDIERELAAFRGEIMQLPPMYSAVKVGGKRLYELAREGKEIERQPRKITVYEAELTGYGKDTREGNLRISCSRGTYIRTIIHDLGNALGCGGAMTSLCRVRAAGFSLGECFTLEQIAEKPLDEVLSPLMKAFESLPKTPPLSGHCTAMYKNGVKLRPEQIGAEGISGDFCVIDGDSTLLGIARTDTDKNEVRAVRNFY
ncbi:MAG: tRNA pseudouridine(55) synthase TruB [Ruminococcus sp.]|nr:tRNA pseudouridine(55) synthase TruB [Ruminococcus sp.]